VADVRLFDSHVHLSDRAFEADRDAVLHRARDAGISELVSVASNPQDARRAISLATGVNGLWATAGLHPHEASSFGERVIVELADLSEDPSVVAIGEAGLDFHYDNSPRDEQRESFRAQLELAEQTGLPIIVHSREADEDTALLISEFAGRVTGVLHCFTGGDSLLEAGLDAGWSVSFSGIVTFTRFDGEAQVRRVPPERLLIETDGPYLSPVPMRGRRNEPAYLIHTCRRVAELRGSTPEEIAEITRRNAFMFFSLES
jgi:TatD DNase family protein